METPEIFVRPRFVSTAESISVQLIILVCKLASMETEKIIGQRRKLITRSKTEVLVSVKKTTLIAILLRKSFLFCLT